MEGDEEPPAAAAMVSVLTDDLLLPFILKRLCPRDLVRAALANKRWRRAAALAVPRAPPLVGYLLHPEKIRSAQIPPVFVPSDASSPRLSLPLAPDDLSGLSVHDIDQGLVILLPCELPEIRLLRILVLDPASGRRALLPPPPRDALPDDQWRQTRRIIGAAVLSRAHPSKMEFQAVCVTIDDDRPRAWVAFVNGDDCVWCVLPRSNSKQTREQFDPNSCGKCCLHDQGQIYWLASDSTYLLALDPPSLEFRFIPASPHLGPQFNNYGIAPVDVFCYYLCWPPAFLATLEKHDDALIENLMILVRIAFYNISYIRGLFSEEFFSDMPLLPTGMQIKKLIPMDDESQRLADWLEKGVYDALRKKFLKTIIFSVYDENGPLLEEYCLSFTYCKEITMDLRLTGSTESIWTLRSDAAESFVNQIWISACSMIQRCISVMSGWGKIPEERIIMMRLLYFDNQTPLDYEPPFFESCDDKRRYYPLSLQTTFPNYTQDMINLHTSDVKSVICNNSKDVFSDSDSEISRGCFYCITEKKPNFYFDSAASRHMSGEKALIQNLNRVAKQHWVSIETAKDASICLDQAGYVKFGEINLSPVFYVKDLKYNIISIGQLDNEKNLIYLGENRINVINTETGVVIGEGQMHHKKNCYKAINIRSLDVLCPGKKKMKSLQESESSKSSGVQLPDPPTEDNEKLLWALDCFCDNHMTGNINILSNLKSVKRSFVTLKGEFEATRIGDVKTDEVVLLNVLYCPDLSVNLISEGQLDREGYSCTRRNHTCKIQHRETKEIVGVADKDNRFMYWVKSFHPFQDPYSKRPREDEAMAPYLKRPRKELSHSV